MADGFSFGRSLFDGILPGTPQVLNLDSSWGRIRSVENHNCLDLKPEVAYPVAHDCAQINDTTTAQAWSYSPDKELKFFDVEQEHSMDYHMCMYAFGDADDNTGFVRVKECPGSLSIDPEMFDNAQWQPIHNPANKLEYKLQNLSNEMCLGEEVTKVKAGKAGKPGPARVRTTWALLDCADAPWWEFLHLFENYKLDEKLCKVAGDPDSCIRYKNRNRKIPVGLIGSDNVLSADDLVFDAFSRPDGPTDQDEDLPAYDDDYYQELYKQYMSMYDYYLNSEFDPYDYTGYGDVSDKTG